MSFLSIFVLALAVTVPGYSEQLTKVAVIDLEKVFASYPQDADVFESIDLLRDDFEERINVYTQMIGDLDRKIDDALKVEDEITAERLENERNELVSDRALYAEIMNRRLMDAYRRIASDGEGIVEDVLTAVERVATDEGYSLVLDSDDLRLLWYSKEIVITDLVINRLRAIAR